MIDLWVILLWTLLDAVVDLIFFWIFGVREISIIINVFLNVLIPMIWFSLWIQAGPPFTQQIQAVASNIENLIAWLVSSFIGFVFSIPISAHSCS
jgi:predicted neutral ceramidase superfamily lipid hydrolase